MRTFRTPLARRFNDAASQYLEHSAPVITGLPLTMACWFQCDDAVANQMFLLSVADNANTFTYHAMLLQGATSVLTLIGRTSTGSGASSSTSVNKWRQDAWSHAAYVVRSATDREAILNGDFANSGTASASRNPSGFDHTTVGAHKTTGAAGSFHSGLIVWPAIWNVALDEAEIAALNAGAHPLSIQPGNLVAFWDWSGADTEFGLRATFPLTNSGTTPVSGRFPSQEIRKPRRRFDEVAAPGGGNRRRRVLICGAAA